MVCIMQQSHQTETDSPFKYRRMIVTNVLINLHGLKVNEAYIYPSFSSARFGLQSDTLSEKWLTKA